MITPRAAKTQETKIEVGDPKKRTVRRKGGIELQMILERRIIAISGGVEGGDDIHHPHQVQKMRRM